MKDFNTLQEIGKKLVERLRWWKEEYCVGRDVQINGKVSPGNQKRRTPALPGASGQHRHHGGSAHHHRRP